MTQDEFREAMNRSKRDGVLLWLTNGTTTGIALGYDSGTDEAVLFKGTRLPLGDCRVLEADSDEALGTSRVIR